MKLKQTVEDIIYGINTVKDHKVTSDKNQKEKDKEQKEKLIV